MLTQRLKKVFEHSFYLENVLKVAILSNMNQNGRFGYERARNRAYIVPVVDFTLEKANFVQIIDANGR